MLRLEPRRLGHLILVSASQQYVRAQGLPVHALRPPKRQDPAAYLAVNTTHRPKGRWYLHDLPIKLVKATSGDAVDGAKRVLDVGICRIRDECFDT